MSLTFKYEGLPTMFFVYFSVGVYGGSVYKCLYNLSMEFFPFHGTPAALAFYAFCCDGPFFGWIYKHKVGLIPRTDIAAFLDLV